MKRLVCSSNCYQSISAHPICELSFRSHRQQYQVLRRSRSSTPASSPLKSSVKGKGKVVIKTQTKDTKPAKTTSKASLKISTTNVTTKGADGGTKAVMTTKVKAKQQEVTKDVKVKKVATSTKKVVIKEPSQTPKSKVLKEMDKTALGQATQLLRRKGKAPDSSTIPEKTQPTEFASTQPNNTKISAEGERLDSRKSLADDIAAQLDRLSSRAPTGQPNADLASSLPHHGTSGPNSQPIFPLVEKSFMQPRWLQDPATLYRPAVTRRILPSTTTPQSPASTTRDTLEHSSSDKNNQKKTGSQKNEWGEVLHSLGSLQKQKRQVQLPQTSKGSRLQHRSQQKRKDKAVLKGGPNGKTDSVEDFLSILADPTTTTLDDDNINYNTNETMDDDQDTKEEDKEQEEQDILTTEATTTTTTTTIETKTTTTTTTTTPESAAADSIDELVSYFRAFRPSAGVVDASNSFSQVSASALQPIAFDTAPALQAKPAAKKKSKKIAALSALDPASKPAEEVLSELKSLLTSLPDILIPATQRRDLSEPTAVWTKKRPYVMQITNEVKTRMTTVSWSHVETYNSCPLKYCYKYICKLPRKTSYAAVYGTAMHAAVQQLSEERLHGKDIDQLSSAGASKMFNEVMNQSASHTLRLPLTSSLTARASNKRRDTARSIQGFIMRENESSHVPVMSEKPFVFRLDYEEIPHGILFIGRIDRVDREEGADGSERIILREYKSTETAYLRMLRDPQQLFIYFWAYEKAFGKQPYKGIIECIATGDKSEWHRRPEQIKKADQMVRKAIVGMSAGVYKAKPSEDNCTRCDWQHQCPASALLKKKEDPKVIEEREKGLLDLIHKSQTERESIKKQKEKRQT